MKNKTGNRILERIATQGNCTNRAMLAADLGLSDKTVNRYVAVLVSEGLVEASTWEGVEALQLTVNGQKERTMDARVRNRT